MKTALFLLLMVTVSGCYTQLSTVSGTYKRQPDFRKVEQQIDDSTRITDYYDNRMYSWYLRNFSYGFGYRYDELYWNNHWYNQTFFPHGWGSYIDIGYGYYPRYYNTYYGYDYLDYRMDRWAWERWGWERDRYYFGYYPHYGGGWVQGGGDEGPGPMVAPRRSSRTPVSSVSDLPRFSNGYVPVTIGSGSASRIPDPAGSTGRRPVEIQLPNPGVSGGASPSLPTISSPTGSSDTGGRRPVTVELPQPAPPRPMPEKPDSPKAKPHNDSDRPAPQPTRQPDPPPSVHQPDSPSQSGSSGSGSNPPRRQGRGR